MSPQDTAYSGQHAEHIPVRVATSGHGVDTAGLVPKLPAAITRPDQLVPGAAVRVRAGADLCLLWPGGQRAALPL